MHFRSILTRCYSFSNGSRYWGHQAKCQTQSSRKEASKVEVKLNLVFCQKRELCHRCTFRTDLHAAKKTHGGKNGRCMQSLRCETTTETLHCNPLERECMERTWAAWPVSQPACPVSWSMIPSLLVIEMLMMIERRYCRYEGKIRLAGKRYCGWQGGHLGNAMCFPGTREWRREICNTRPPCNTAVL